MRSWIFRFAVFVGALTVGLNLFFLTRSTGPLTPYRNGMPYCKVARNADFYHDTDIRVRARVVFGSGGMYVYENCDPVEALASTVELEGAEESSGAGYVEEVLVTGEKPHIKTAEAIIEGRFNAHQSFGCWSPKFHITARKIELISEISDYKVREK